MGHVISSWSALLTKVHTKPYLLLVLSEVKNTILNVLKWIAQRPWRPTLSQHHGWRGMGWGTSRWGRKLWKWISIWKMTGTNKWAMQMGAQRDPWWQIRSDWVDIRDARQMGFQGIWFSQEACSTTMGTSTLAPSTRKSNKAENYRAHVFTPNLSVHWSCEPFNYMVKEERHQAEAE